MTKPLKRQLKRLRIALRAKKINVRQFNNKLVERSFIALSSLSLLAVIVMLNQHHDDQEQRYRDCHFYAVGVTYVINSCEDKCNDQEEYNDLDTEALTQNLNHYHRLRNSSIHKTAGFNQAYEQCLSLLNSDMTVDENRYSISLK